MSGFFIVLDGPDATGTSTHSRLLTERLQKEGHEVLLTSEPTDGAIGKEIKEYLQSGAADPMELQMMFTRDREWHVQNVIGPALKAGTIVVCDRYWYSTLVYAAAQNLSKDDIRELKSLNNIFIQPDCAIFTLPPLEIALKRMEKRESKDIFEREHFQKLIHAGYRNLAEDERFHTVDTSASKEEVSEKIAKIVSHVL